jgi:hypothetical protein
MKSACGGSSLSLSCALLPSLTPPPPPLPLSALPVLQGLAPNYVKVVPSIAIAFVTYEQVKELLGVEFRISE